MATDSHSTGLQNLAAMTDSHSTGLQYLAAITDFHSTGLQYLAATTSKDSTFKGGGKKVNPLFQTRQVCVWGGGGGLNRSSRRGRCGWVSE